MRRMVLTSLAALLIVGWQTPIATAQETKTARGTVTAVSPDSVTVKVGDHDMKFAVDAQTKVTARGGSTKTRQAQAAGAPGVKVNELLSAGQAVEVTYHDMGGTMHAASIRTVPSPGPGGGSVSSPAPAAKTASGTVKSVSASSLTISDGGKDSTFTVDSSTKVVGKGAGTKAAAAGGKTSITELVSNGDHVSVTYHDMGGTMHAATVRIATKAATKH